MFAQSISSTGPAHSATNGSGVALGFVLAPITDPAQAAPVARGGFGYLSAEKPAPSPSAEDLAHVAALLSAEKAVNGFAPDADAAAFMRLIGHDLALMQPTGGVQSRAEAADMLINLRRGSLDLSSIYGPDETPMPGLRDPSAPARLLASTGAQMPSADPRNHVSPALSRLHRALIALHNMAVENCDDPGLASAGPDALFGYARTEVRMLVQWLTMNAALPALCPKGALDAVADGRAPLFSRMVARMGGGVPAIPLEALMGALPLITRTAEERAAARVDVDRLLQLGRRIALPSGQETVRAVNRALGTRIAPLTDGELCVDPMTPAMKGDMLLHTPLVIYLSREADERGEDGRLGPVGGHVAVQSIAGLIFSDPYAYWMRPGNTGGRWRPEDGVLRVNGRPIDTIAGLLHAADA